MARWPRGFNQIRTTVKEAVAPQPRKKDRNEKCTGRTLVGECATDALRRNGADRVLILTKELVRPGDDVKLYVGGDFGSVPIRHSQRRTSFYVQERRPVLLLISVWLW